MQRAARTYGAAADHYTKPALGFWDRFGSATVSRLGLAAGGSVLDLCCGAGGSAIPAARAVGPSGRVLGVDIARPQLELARARAAREGLAQVSFRHGDATSTGLPSGVFDAVVCVFGVFFAPDMAAFVAEMWRLARPGGVVAITTWGPGLFEPANSRFWRCVGEAEPTLFKAFNPWDEITTPSALAGLFVRAGVPSPSVVAVASEGVHHLDHPDQFWDIVLGSGYRATVDALSPEQRYRVRSALLGGLRADAVTALRTDVVYGTASRPRLAALHSEGEHLAALGAGRGTGLAHVRRPGLDRGLAGRARHPHRLQRVALGHHGQVLGQGTEPDAGPTLVDVVRVPQFPGLEPAVPGDGLGAVLLRLAFVQRRPRPGAGRCHTGPAREPVTRLPGG